MKVIKFLIVCMLSIPASGWAQPPAPDSSYATPYYAQRLAFFRQMPDRKREIVFLGDGLTELGEWQELLPGRRVINRGITGDNTYGVLARLDEVLSSQPAKIFLMIGLIDLRQDVPDVFILRNFERILSQIRIHSPRTRVYLLSVLPLNEALRRDDPAHLTNERIRELNRKIALLAEAQQVPFVNMYEVYADENGQLRAGLTWDGLHLKAGAYVDWVGYLRFLGYLK